LFSVRVSIKNLVICTCLLRSSLIVKLVVEVPVQNDYCEISGYALATIEKIQRNYRALAFRSELQ
jgi:hypothetical protein